MKSPVLIVASRDDLHAAAVFDALERKVSCPEWIDVAGLNRDIRLALKLDVDTRDGVLLTSNGRALNLSEIGTIWWRRPRLPEYDGDLDS